jgi:hypothetical protein
VPEFNFLFTAAPHFLSGRVFSIAADCLWAAVRAAIPDCSRSRSAFQVSGCLWPDTVRVLSCGVPGILSVLFSPLCVDGFIPYSFLLVRACLLLAATGFCLVRFPLLVLHSVFSRELAHRCSREFAAPPALSPWSRVALRVAGCLLVCDQIFRAGSVPLSRAHFYCSCGAWIVTGTHSDLTLELPD